MYYANTTQIQHKYVTIRVSRENPTNCEGKPHQSRWTPAAAGNSLVAAPLRWRHRRAGQASSHWGLAPGGRVASAKSRFSRRAHDTHESNNHVATRAPLSQTQVRSARTRRCLCWPQHHGYHDGGRPCGLPSPLSSPSITRLPYAIIALQRMTRRSRRSRS